MQTVPEQTDVLVLAYLGDALYEIAVRERVIQSSHITRADLLHRAGVHYVCAASQAHALKVMMDSGFLSEAEQALARRAHNHRIATKAKNASAADYKWATGFEALIGYLRLSGQEERLSEVLEASARLAESF